MTSLTAHQTDTLTRTHREGELRRTHTDQPGADPWPAPAASIRSLVKRGLLEETERRNRAGRRMTVWTLTDAGREALDPPRPPAKDTPNLLRVKGRAVTGVWNGTQWEYRAVPEPEKVKGTPDRRWGERAAARLAEDRPWKRAA